MKAFLFCSFCFILEFTVTISQNRGRRQFWPPPPPNPMWPGRFPPVNNFLENSNNPWEGRLEEPNSNNPWGGRLEEPTNIQFENFEEGFENNGNDWNNNERTTTTTSAPSTSRTIHLTPEGCNCLSTPQFNPVCGSDGNTYKNAGLLKCFRQCGVNVSQKRMGSC